MLKQPNPITEKVKVLYELGMTDKAAVKAHLITETSGIKDPLKMEMKLDRVAHTMIMRFFDGDRQFVAKSTEKEKENETPNDTHIRTPWAYCELRHCTLTAKEIQKKECLKKKCWHFSRLSPSFIKGK